GRRPGPWPERSAGDRRALVPGARGRRAGRLRGNDDDPGGGADSASAARSNVLLGEQGVGPQAEGRAQLVGVEIGERAGLGQDEVGDVALARHDLLDTLVDGARADQAVGDDRALLADAPGPVPGLVLDSGVPPAVVEDDVAGGGEVETGAAGLERKDQRTGSVQL